MVARAFYGLGQAARTAWFGAQYIAAQKLAPRVDPPPGPPRKSAGWGFIMRDLANLYRQEWRNIEAGYYPPPADILPHPGKALRNAARFFNDLPAVNLRRRTGAKREVLESALKGRRPSYYLQNFHFQSDGWISEESAARYDHQVEVLFTGGADSMRRQALVPIGDWVRANGVEGRRLVDIGAGTGRFLYDVKRALPNLDVTAIDLSEAYLNRARQVLRRYASTCFVQGKAESMPFETKSCDLLTSVYLFHELPKDIRRRAAKEMARILIPGGRIVIVDSVILGDCAHYDTLLDRFPVVFHEPYYRDFVRDPLEPVFEGAGLRHVETRRAFFSRVMVFDKPV